MAPRQKIIHALRGKKERGRVLPYKKKNLLYARSAAISTRRKKRKGQRSGHLVTTLNASDFQKETDIRGRGGDGRLTKRGSYCTILEV